jgi:prepilin-type N-terminal cleavage/methylation domain-containing protein
VPYRPKLGFTLLELLAALAVLAVLASLSFRGLSSVLDSEAHVREQAKRWSEVGLLLGQLREDTSSAMEGRGFTLGPLGGRRPRHHPVRRPARGAAAARRLPGCARAGWSTLLWAQGMDAGPPAAAYAVARQRSRHEARRAP